MNKHTELKNKICSIFRAARDASGGVEGDLMICIEMNHFNNGELGICISNCVDNSQLLFETNFTKSELIFDVLTFYHDDMNFYKESMCNRDMLLSEFCSYMINVDVNSDAYEKYKFAIERFYKLAKLSWKLYHSGELKIVKKL